MSPFQPWGYGLNEIRFQASDEGFSQEALAELLDNVPLAIAVTLGPQHRFAFANRLYRSALSGLTDDLIGKTLLDVVGGHYRAEHLALRQHVLETGEAREIGSAPFTLTSGKTTYWDIKLLPVRGADDQISGVLTLAANVTERAKARNDAEYQAREAALYNERLALAVDATELGLWEWNAQTGQTYWSERQKDIYGLPKDEPVTYELWLSALYAEDRDRVVESVNSLLDPASGGQLHLEHRIVRPDGEIRWIVSRGRMLYEIVDGVLKPVRLLGTILDITERRKGEEARILLAQELNHRVKNLFAIASGMVTLTARSAQTPKEMASSLRGRLEALARAHELIRPAIADDAPTQTEASVGDVIRAILAPHIEGEETSQLTVEGPLVPVGPKSATGLTLVLHELATNASKYGALSVHEGCLRITWTQDGNTLVLLWQEENGPPIAETPASEGFGSQLARKSVTVQLGGEIACDWRKEGLHVRIHLPLDQLSQ